MACLYPTRSQASAACAGGKVDLNGRAASAHKKVRPGDRLAITFSGGKRTFLVRGILVRHVRKADARTLYEETTPPPPQGVLEAQRLERLLAPHLDAPGGGRPTKKERRDRERTRGW